MGSMNYVVLACLSINVICLVQSSHQNVETEEIRAKAFLGKLNNEIRERYSKESIATWNYITNVTAENAEQQNAIAAENAKYYKEKSKEILEFDFNAFKDDDLKRQFKLLSKLGYAALPADKFSLLRSAVTSMKSNYAKVHVCSFKNETNCNLQLEPELTEILQKSKDPEELKYYWIKWYDLAGTAMRKDFETYLQLNKEAANLNNFTSGAELWLAEYEDDTLEEQLEKIFEEIRPFYLQLHAYVRHSLKQTYGEAISDDGPIPMHLLGNMWAQSWNNIYDQTAPYPNRKSEDLNKEMIAQNYTALKMFELAEEFYVSLNMSALPESFWELSYIEKPTDGREFICHGYAYDFFKNSDVAIKMCTRISIESFFTVFHEMGHIYYYLQYKNQPIAYRDGANHGFHEAIGDVFFLSASTSKHMHKIGLLKNYEPDEETRINELYQMALKKVAFLPFGYSLDQYRWALFRGEVKSDEYNCKFWQIRESASGIKPPVQRYKEDFDAPAKFHVSADVEYLRYVVAHILQFQFHKGACILAGEYDPNNPNSFLSECDIYQSTKAGNAIKEMLSLGLSKPWPDALEIVTGQRIMSASALMEYFKPLQDWLEKKNKETGAQVGWKSEFKCLSKSGAEKPIGVGILIVLFVTSFVGMV